MTVKLILVDDHNLFVEGLHTILNDQIGIEVMASAANGLELLDLMEIHRPNIILTDIRMPRMDGIAIAKLFKKQYPKTHIIALSMFDQDDDVFDMLEAGAKGYVVKNAERDELLRAIHEVHKGKYYLSPKFEGIYQRWLEKDKIAEPKLTRRERQILRLISRGKTSQQISEELKLSRFTIDTHRKNIHKKLGTKSNLALAKQAYKILGMD
ncbi:response regulator transcription factor [Maribacter sp. PR1]|uniref:Response regulator transcription factor n=1 Tax=Maribacter cobaltidurans TaxID=1178778 RepID=A0ABU7IQP3_9FLAO|nr:MULTISPECIES: response regulator transcription factor [Maribacter]MDC6387891.1 response regulator transcription factor [Maribacter sp. PR1]MEE1975280.1 response regulator transcription factor [Maribacter cobaltidurans]